MCAMIFSLSLGLYISQFGHLAKAANTLVVPANLSDIASMLALATRVVADGKEKV